MKHSRKRVTRCLPSLALLLLAGVGPVFAEVTNDIAPRDFSALIADRTAVERVYYRHRLETTLPFEQVLPPEAVEQLVRRDLEGEQLLQKKFGLVITDLDVKNEMARIDASTHAPEVLEELKQALDHDPARFGRTVVRPILVDRWMRERAKNNAAPHASERTRVELLLVRLNLARSEHASPEQLIDLARENGTVNELTWQLDAPAEAGSGANSKSYSSVATAGVAPAGTTAPLRFADLRPELQALAREQLRGPGDVSAVVETDEAFVLFIARDRAGDRLRVASVSIPKARPGHVMADGKTAPLR